MPAWTRRQAQSRPAHDPVIVVSRDAINAVSPVVIAVPCTTLRPGRRLYPSHVVIRRPEAGFDVDTVALCEQVRALAKSRLFRFRGMLPDATLAQIDRALLIALAVTLVLLARAINVIAV